MQTKARLDDQKHLVVSGKEAITIKCRLKARFAKIAKGKGLADELLIERQIEAQQDDKV